jgi:hypothetical protein
MFSCRYQKTSFPCNDFALAYYVFRLDDSGIGNNDHTRIFPRGNPTIHTIQEKILCHIYSGHLNSIYWPKTTVDGPLDNKFNVSLLNQIPWFYAISNQDESPQVNPRILYPGYRGKIPSYASLLDKFAPLPYIRSKQKRVIANQSINCLALECALPFHMIFTANPGVKGRLGMSGRVFTHRIYGKYH